MCAVVFSAMYGEKIHLEIGHKILLIALLAVLQPTAALIDCRTACRKCHDNSEDKPILEVYCAMCDECKQRRKEKLEARTATTEAIQPPAMARTQSSMANRYQVSEEEQQTTSFSMPWTKRTMPTMNPNYDYLHNTNAPEPLRARVGGVVYPEGCPTPPPCPESEEIRVTQNFMPTTPSTTTSAPCPPINGCRKKKNYQPCFPCFPMCPCPGVSQTQGTTDKQYYNVYIGVPKNLLRRG